jgi:hypothetical protein
MMMMVVVLFPDEHHPIRVTCMMCFDVSEVR